MIVGTVMLGGKIRDHKFVELYGKYFMRIVHRIVDIILKRKC